MLIKLKHFFNFQRLNEPEVEGLLKEVREDFAKDGQKWDSSPEKNLANMWKKYKRTQEHLERKVEEFEAYKKKRKQEFDELQMFVVRNKELQTKRDEHLKRVMEENSKLSKQIKQNEIERAAYLKQQQSLADLLNTEGLSTADFDPSKKVENLIREHESDVVKIQEQEQLIKQVQEEKVQIEEEKTALEKEKVEIAVQIEEQREKLKAKEETLISSAKTYDEQQVEVMKLTKDLESKTIEVNALNEIKESLTNEVELESTIKFFIELIIGRQNAFKNRRENC